MANGSRVPTGIVELDSLIEGGLRPGKTYLVVGEPGTGKTVFGLQYLVNGLMEKEKGLYVAIDEKPADDSKEEPAKHAKGKKPQFPVVIKTDPEGSKVTTGNHTFGTTPLTLRLRPGNSYEFTFTKAAYTPLSRRYRFDREQPQTLRVTLKKAPEPPHKAAPPPPPPPARGAPPMPAGKGFFSRAVSAKRRRAARD